MNDQEVNKIIAEFMGWKYCPTHNPSPVFIHERYAERCPSSFKYTKSLDALVPVWERLIGKIEYEVRLRGQDEMRYSARLNIPRVETFFVGGFGTIQQASAHATAKAILAL